MFLSLVAWALVALGRAPRSAGREVEPTLVAEAEPRSWAPTAAPVRTRRSASRRLAASVTFAALFFAGASLSAIAGDRAATLLDDDGAEISAASEPDAGCESPERTELGAEYALECPEEAAGEAAELTPQAEAPSEESAEEPAVSFQAASAASAATAQTEATPAETESVAAPEVEASEPEAAPAAPGAAEAEPAEDRQGKSRAPAIRPAARQEASAPERAPSTAGETPSRSAGPQLDPEASAPGVAATIWLHRLLPDPTPPSLRLSRTFAAQLVRSSREAGVDWALVLGVMRAEGGRGPLPSRPATVAETAGRLVALGARRDPWDAALAFTGRTAMSDRAIALAGYYRAIGIDALTNGLRGEQRQLTERLLSDSRVDVYGGGRDDLAAGRVDVRVVALIGYLAEVYGQVTVSSLKTGHRLYSRPGVVSAHVYGHAIDVAALGGVPILGHQQPGSITERAVRDILLLPAEMRPRQLISLIGMGGPSFPLGDHHDHIHVGY